MKLIVAFVQNQDLDALFRALAERGLRATRIASSGGFLRHANATVFIGLEDERLQECLDIMRLTCGHRIHHVTSGAVAEMGDLGLESITPVEQGGAVVLVMPVERFVQFRPALAANPVEQIR